MGVFRRGGGRLRGDITKYILVKAGEELGVVGAFLAAGRWGAAAVPRQAGDHKGQSISKKRPSRFVIPSLRSRASSEHSEGSLAGQRSFAALRMTILNWLRLTRKASSLKWIGHKGPAILRLMYIGGSCEHTLSSFVSVSSGFAALLSAPRFILRFPDDR